MSVKNETPFHTLRPKWKLYTFLKQKRSVSCEFPRKSENDSFWLILSRKKAFEMKSVFCWYQLRNLAQTNAFWYILLNVNILTQKKIQPFEF